MNQVTTAVAFLSIIAFISFLKFEWRVQMKSVVVKLIMITRHHTTTHQSRALWSSKLNTTGRMERMGRTCHLSTLLRTLMQTTQAPRIYSGMVRMGNRCHLPWTIKSIKYRPMREATNRKPGCRPTILRKKHRVRIRGVGGMLRFMDS